MIGIETGLSRTGIPFDGSDRSDGTATTRIDIREAFYDLVNIEEHPTFLPAAWDVAKTALAVGAQQLVDARHGVYPRELEELVSRLSEHAVPNTLWQGTGTDFVRHQALHLFTQYVPTGLLDACWLAGGSRVPMAHTQIGAIICGLYLHQLRASAAEAALPSVEPFRDTCRRLGLELEEVSSRDFANRREFSSAAFRLPVFLMSIGQFPRNLYAEILGVNLAWQSTGMSAFGLRLSAAVNEAFNLEKIDTDFDAREHTEKSKELAIAAIGQLIECCDDQVEAADAYERILRGAGATVAALREWFSAINKSAPLSTPDPRQEMVDMIWQKAPHACGYHGNRHLGGRRIDDYLNGQKFDGSGLLDALATSAWVKPRQPKKSLLLTRLIGPGGPMVGVFAPREQKIIENWINSLPAQAAPSPEAGLDTRPKLAERDFIECRCWSPEAFSERSSKRFGRCSVRELYHYLINVEANPEILPVAERFAANRLKRSMATLQSGERPIPSVHYDPSALERWVETKHREQVDSYRPPSKRPEVPKPAFIEATVQLAPLILIDGGWLQGVTSAAVINTAVGRMLLHVFIEEIGQGSAAEHHANIYRDLLDAMAVAAPPVDTWEFAHWDRLQDDSFEVPTFWLAISCFPRHFLPEIMGLNLAVELAGVGGPYMEARDTLKSFGYPTRFVDVHNAADNITAGHSAWAMNAIKRYMSEVIEREGPRNLDWIWHRIWTGVRATLPPLGVVRTLTHRFRQPLRGQKLWQVPLIFPS